MIINVGFLRPVSVEIHNTLLKRSILTTYPLCNESRVFYRFKAAKKILLAFKRNRELEIYKGRIFTVPNILTVSRLVVSPIFPWLLLNGHNKCAFGLLAYCGLTDILDGWIARKFNQKSVLGSILDPVADKLTVIIFAYSLLLSGHIPTYLSTLIISKDLIMLLSGFILRLRSLRRHNVPFKQFFDPKVASVEIKPLLLSKFNTVLQFATLGISILSFEIPVLSKSFMHVATAFSTSITAIAHGFQYRKVVRNIKS